MIGTRTLDEITDGLLAAVADTRTGPLEPAKAELVDAYMRIAGSPCAAAQTLGQLVRRANVDLAPALATFSRRNDLLAAAGLDIEGAEFSAEFGRKFEYYTGFVFEIVSPALGDKSPIAGGGRYDGLLQAIGAPRRVPAIGASIYTERLLAALGGGTP